MLVNSCNHSERMLPKAFIIYIPTDYKFSCQAYSLVIFSRSYIRFWFVSWRTKLWHRLINKLPKTSSHQLLTANGCTP